MTRLTATPHPRRFAAYPPLEGRDDADSESGDMNPWPLLTLAAAGLLVARNAAQRELTAQLGIWGATYVRFLYGLPFALVYTALVVWLRGYSSGPNWEFFWWIMFDSVVQWAATAGVVLAMRGRAFAVATAFTKTEV